MGRNADLVELGEDQLGYAVVENALAVDHFLLLVVEGGGIILVVDDQGSRLGTLIEDLGLALVDTGAALVHRHIPSSKTSLARCGSKGTPDWVLLHCRGGFYRLVASGLPE